MLPLSFAAPACMQFPDFIMKDSCELAASPVVHWKMTYIIHIAYDGAFLLFFVLQTCILMFESSFWIVISSCLEQATSSFSNELMVETLKKVSEALLQSQRERRRVVSWNWIHCNCFKLRDGVYVKWIPLDYSPSLFAALYMSMSISAKRLLSSFKCRTFSPSFHKEGCWERER